MEKPFTLKIMVKKKKTFPSKSKVSVEVRLFCDFSTNETSYSL